MIENILFDMGGVLLRFEPETFIARLNLGEEDGKLLLREVFHSVEWVMLDRGSLTDDEALERMRGHLPARLHSAAEELVRHWDEPRLPKEDMAELVAELSEEGYGLYLLTNANLRHRSYWPGVPVSKFFGDRIMLSAAWKLLKPEAAFYEKALDLFGLDRTTCLFIDDNPINVEGALRVGLDALVYHNDPALLRRQLKEKGVRIAV